MEKRGGRRSKQIGNPDEMLSEARDGLAKCRELFILSTLMLLTTKEGLVFWGNIWFNASSEEERITRELVAPAKLRTGAFRTVPAVEDVVRANASDLIQNAFGFEPKLARGLAKRIVNPHIESTKKIQKKMGVPENIVHLQKTTNARREHTIFAREPAQEK